MKNNVQGNLAALREAMKKHGVSAAIIPQADPHMSEYISNHWQARRMLSGFSGSAGDLVVTLDKALLWTDSRYFLQAGQQLEGTEIVLMKDGLPGTPSISDWLKGNLRAGEKVGIDGLVFSTLAKESLAMELESAGLVLVSDFDVLDEIWKDRPALPDGAVFIHPEVYCGKSARTKIEEVLEGVKKEGADGIFISALDEIAWTLNIRSNDVKYNPVATAFLYLSKDDCTLLINSRKVSEEVALYLNEQGVKMAEYSSVKAFLAGLPTEKRVLVDPARNAAAIVDILGSRAVKASSPVALLKACKNEAQLAGIREAMVRDGVAMVKSLHEIKSKVAAGEKLTEMNVAEILRKYRSAGKFYYEESFGTIAGYGPHGAIVHYEADEDSNSELKAEGLLLIDSGAQYLDGTTDITRTISLGAEPTADEKRDFTLVMKGHIALGSAVFPEGTTGHQLDALARQFLWKEGLSYLHGTGHGVGHFLNVHEGPQSIRLNYVPTSLRPGMITSNEPGLYREGVHGIRCENLVLTTEAMETEFGKFYKFETLTLCPFERSLFDTSIMSDQEIEWVNEYHRKVAAALSPLLDGDDKEWLLENTKEIKK